MNGTITDDGGNKSDFSFRAIIVPGLGTNLFSVSMAMVEGMAALFYQDSTAVGEGRRRCADENLGCRRNDWIQYVLRRCGAGKPCCDLREA